MRVRKLFGAFPALGTGRRFLASAATVGLMMSGFALAAPAATAVASSPTVYNSIPGSLPGNVLSQPFQAQQTSEFGDLVTLAPGSRNALSVDVIMSSWGCQTGGWSTDDCLTTPGATFTHPITLNLYDVNNSGALPEPGALIASQTHTFAIPYRASADPADCPSAPGKWFNLGDSTCYNGFATKISFDLSSSAITLPESVIWAVSFNTSNYGPAPIGDAACSPNCPYDSLNVGAQSFAGQPSSGMDVDPDGAMLSSITPGVYCDGGTGGTGTLRDDTPCWTGFRPLARITTGNLLGPCIVSVTPGTVLTYTLQADCTTDHTVVVPQNAAGTTVFDGNGHSITGVDPAGGHFVGAVIQGETGAHAITVKNLTVTAPNLHDVCDGGVDRLRGILYDGVPGTIKDNTVTNVNQGTSGCQEGNAIEVRNDPFDKTGPDFAVTISGNTVSGYQKNGITANGSVAATIKSNTVTGSGPVNYIAQNGIQVGFGGTAIVTLNSASANFYTGADVACGLLLYQADGAKVSKNNFFNNERDQCNFGKGTGKFKPSSA
jgi:parallel beta helix pectate lyase-like protein